MTAAAIASKFRRALRNGTGATLTPEQLRQLAEYGVLEPFGIFAPNKPPPLHSLVGMWPVSPVVYFIGPADGPVKIGYATDFRARWRHLRYMSPAPLHVWAFASGGFALEREYHERFKSARLHGEWFDRTDELIAEMRLLREGIKA